MGFFNFFGQGNINQGVEEYKATPGAVLLDVRTISEYREGHIPGSKNVPLQQLEKAAAVAEDESSDCRRSSRRCDCRSKNQKTG